MHTLQRHIGAALLACSFVLFMLWAIPYAGGLDAFSLSASAAGIGTAPEHTQIERQMKILHQEYANAKNNAAILNAQNELLATVEKIFEDENPNGELLRGDATYLVAIYTAALGKPCAADLSKAICSKLGGATAILDFETSREHLSELEDDGSLFQDIQKSDWYMLYVGMLVGMNIVHPELDASSVGENGRLFAPNSPVFAADYERWLYRAQMGSDPENVTTPPGATLTKRQGKDMLLSRLEQAFTARAARR